MKFSIAAIFLALCVTLTLGATALAALYPTDVQELADGSGRRIVRVYELSPDETPDDIPRESFERGGFRFELTEIVRQETELADNLEHSETVTVESATKELTDVLPLFAATMEYASEDGYSGVLTLDVSTLTVAEAGRSNQAYTMKTTREYPHLSSNDSSLLPKTVTERGLTYTLSNVDWRPQNLETVDYTALPESYRAIATYTVSGVTSKVTGYVTTAEYRGEITKTLPGKVRYTAYFVGTPLATAPPLPSAAPEAPIAVSKLPFNPIPLICISGGALILGAGVFFAFKKLKGKIRKF